MTRPVAPPEIIDPAGYERNGYPHAAFEKLRSETPLAWCECDGFEPFWAVTRLDDIVSISKQPELFHNAPRMTIQPTAAVGGDVDITRLVRHLLLMEPPDHRRYRSLTSARFTPRAIEPLRPGVTRIVDELLDRVAARGAEPFDFVTEVAAVMPIEVIAELLGIPREDHARFFRWTNELIAPGDPEFQRVPGESPVEAALQEIFAYFGAMVEARRKRPAADITSVLANASLEGPIPDFELFSYLMLLIAAGNETTRNAMSGGLSTLLEHPGELEKLRRNPSLIRGAVEEIVRWVSPLIQFCRRATQDVELHGQRIRAGEDLALFYPSANRDETHFEAPFEFRVDRRPNPHIAFGIGEHVCLGAHLARMELQEFFGGVVRRLVAGELAGPVDRLRSSFVGGIKRLPVKLELRA